MPIQHNNWIFHFMEAFFACAGLVFVAPFECGFCTSRLIAVCAP